MSPNPYCENSNLASAVHDTNSSSPPPSPIKPRADLKENYDGVVRCATAALLSMKTASRSKFTIATQKLNPMISPGLLQIKENTMILPHDGLLSLSRIGELFHTLHSEFGTYRCQLDNAKTRVDMENMSIKEKTAKTEEVTEELVQSRNKFFDGGNEILDQHESRISKVLNLIKENKKDIEEKLRLIYELEDNIKYRQGLLEALKDKAVPDFMEGIGSSSATGACVQALTTLILWAADVVMSSITFHISFKQDQELEVLKICKSTLESQLDLIATTEEEVGRQKSAWLGARDMLRKLDAQIWVTSLRAIEKALASEDEDDDPLNVALQEIDRLSTKQTLALRPIRRNQARLNADIGSGIHIKRDVELFCDVVPAVLEDLKLLRSAKPLMKSDDQVNFETRICDLGRVIFQRLKQFNDLYYKGSEVPDPNEQEMFLKRGTFDFAGDTRILIQAIRNILQTGVSTKKGKKLSKKRDNGDRYHGHCSWDGRPMITSTEGLSILQRVELSIEFIHNLSISSCTGMFLRSTGKRETQVDHSTFDFNLSNATLSDFWDVMRKIVEPGVEYFNNATVEKPKSRFGLPKLG